MRASINILQYEHGVIRQVTDVLGDMVRKRNYQDHQDKLPQVIQFLDRYVDRCHHTLEERFVFPRAKELSEEISRDVDHLIAQHRDVRKKVQDMDALMSSGLVSDDRFHRLAHDVVEELGHHIQHEEDELFPKLEDVVDIDEDGEIFERMNEFIVQNFGEDFHGKYEDYSFRIQDEILGPGFYGGVV
jgi:hemerythrin-like domain-containing protein